MRDAFISRSALKGIETVKILIALLTLNTK
jgi:hypothetical protein